MSSRIIVGEALARLADLPDESVHCVVTSPPYWNLRDYGTGTWEGGDPACDHQRTNPRRDHSHGTYLGTRGEQSSNGAMPMGASCYRCGAERRDEQLGLEATPEEFVSRLVVIFREVRRVLRADGVVWLNMGDSYNNRRVTRPSSHQGGLGFSSENIATSWRDHAAAGRASLSIADGDLKEKDLVGVPWMLAFALRADGWYLRSDVIWAKPNSMPESIRDRPTQAHEHVFLLSRSARYFYDADAIREPYAEGSEERIMAGFKDRYSEVAAGGFRGAYGGPDGEQVNPAGRNKRNVWEIATMPYAEAHFATFPPALVEPCVLAGSSPRCCGVCAAPWRRVSERVASGWDGSTYGERAVQATGGALTGGTEQSTLGSSNGSLTAEYRTVGWEPSCEHHDGSGRAVVLDPFAGSGTVGVVCEWFGRDFVGIELSPAYAEMARRRIAAEGPLGRRARRPREMVAEQLGLGI